MDYSSFSLILILAAFASFLTGILSSLNQEAFGNFIKTPSKSSKALIEIWENYDNTLKSLFFTEIFLYSSAGMFGAYIISGFELNIAVLIGIIILFIVAVFIFRFIVFALGKKSSSTSADKFVWGLKLISFFSMPFIILTNKLEDSIGGIKNEARDEINELVETAREEGSLDDDEYRILKNIMKFSDVLVSDVMTPRTVVFSCKSDSKVSDIVNMPELQMYSRFPIWEGESIDESVIGYVMTKDMYQAALRGKTDRILSDFAREVYFIPENAPLDAALDMFLQRRQHLFVVVDEYGGVEGLLTMEDVLETMLGVEIVDEVDRFIDMRLLAKQRRDRRISHILPE